MDILSEIRQYLNENTRDNAELAHVVINGDQDPFSRSTLPGHITGSSFVVDFSLSKALLIHHAGLGIWVQPGGHVDPGERPVDAALRETLEETGVSAVLASPMIFDMDIHEIPASAKKNEPAHHHIDVRYLVWADSTESVVLNPDECHAYQWVDLKLLSEEKSSVGRMAILALAHISTRWQQMASSF